MFIDHLNPKHANEVLASMFVALAATSGMFLKYEFTKIIGLTVAVGIGTRFLNSRFVHWIGGLETASELMHEEHRPLKSDKPFPNQCIDALKSSPETASFGLLFACIARVPFLKFRSKITAKRLAPYMIIGMALTTLIAYGQSRLVSEKPSLASYITYTNTYRLCSKILAVALATSLLANRVGRFKF